jgi:hypothetical protein
MLLRGKRAAGFDARRLKTLSDEQLGIQRVKVAPAGKNGSTESMNVSDKTGLDLRIDAKGTR